MRTRRRVALCARTRRCCRPRLRWDRSRLLRDLPGLPNGLHMGPTRRARTPAPVRACGDLKPKLAGGARLRLAWAKGRSELRLAWAKAGPAGLSRRPPCRMGSCRERQPLRSQQSAVLVRKLPRGNFRSLRQPRCAAGEGRANARSRAGGRRPHDAVRLHALRGAACRTQHWVLRLHSSAVALARCCALQRRQAGAAQRSDGWCNAVIQRPLRWTR